MSWLLPRTRILRSLVPNSRGTIAFVVLACLAGARTAAAASPPQACEREISATSDSREVPEAIRRTVRRSVQRASALSRLDRADEALAKLDALIALMDGPRGERVQDGQRAELTQSIRALKRCLAARPQQPLTWVTIAVFDEPNTPDVGRGDPAGAGVFVEVEGITIGRTGADGTLEAKLPLGVVEVAATKYPSSWGAGSITVSAGESQTVSIVMLGDKEPSEETDLLLEEAPDGILPANPASITLKFTEDGHPVRIETIESIEMSDVDGGGNEDLGRSFAVRDGVMIPTDTAAVLRILEQRSENGRPVRLNASAVDLDGRTRYGEVTFQTGRYKLTVTLAAPPSNPALRVSNIPVRVTVGGGDVAIARVSDASGHFEIDLLPDATLQIDAHTTASADHYYADAFVTLCGNTSATILLRSVTDIVAGVRGAIVDSSASSCAPTPRR
jgi:hypothetical protein